MKPASQYTAPEVIEALTVHLPKTTNSNNPTTAHRRLWQAVLCRAFKDAIGNPGLNQHKARAWLTGESVRFKEVSLFAGYEPYYVFQKAKALEKDGWPNRRKEPHLKAA